MRSICRGLFWTIFLAVGAGLALRVPVKAVQNSQTAAETRSPRFQGVASCAASGCHHANGERGTKGSEYTTWLIHDPHARAYEVLLNERSKRIERNLRHLPDLKAAHPEKSALCLNCHVSPGIDRASRPARFSLADGVGCESCHGPAEKWLGPHRTWKNLADADRQRAYAENSMVWLRDPRSRAGACAGCHVGDAVAEVNHDLIAAGHPRLTFAYSAYLAHMPAHWDAAGERKRRPDNQARSWAIGQAAGARAALQLLAARTQTGKPWPEFAEYDCASCHRILPAPGEKETGRIGFPLPWANWNFAALPRALAFQPAAENAKCLAALNDLRTEMQKPSPNAGETNRRALELAGLLDRWLATSGSGKYDDVNLLRQSLAALGEANDSTRDGRFQRYYGMTALYRTLLDLNAENKDPLIAASVERLEKQLRSPKKK